MLLLAICTYLNDYPELLSAFAEIFSGITEKRPFKDSTILSESSGFPKPGVFKIDYYLVVLEIIDCNLQTIEGWVLEWEIEARRYAIVSGRNSSCQRLSPMAA